LGTNLVAYSLGDVRRAGVTDVAFYPYVQGGAEPACDPTTVLRSEDGELVTRTPFDRTDLLDVATRELFDWLAADKLHSPRIRQRPFTEAGVATAHLDLDNGRTIAKLVLVPAHR
jgi:NADPH:quinone reductase-like Zn-dependent oxidoreductase